MVIPTLKTCYFETSEYIMTKFKSQALHIIRIKYWKASGSGNPPSLNPALRKIAILGLKTGLWQWYNGISVFFRKKIGHTSAKRTSRKINSEYIQYLFYNPTRTSVPFQVIRKKIINNISNKAFVSNERNNYIPNWFLIFTMTRLIGLPARLWQYHLWSFNSRDTKIAKLLPKKEILVTFKIKYWKALKRRDFWSILVKNISG